MNSRRSSETEHPAADSPPHVALHREPLLHFLALGALLFALHYLLAAPTEEQDDPRRIVLTAAHRDDLRQQWVDRIGTTPTEADEERMIRQWIDREILYREALSLGLHEDDAVVRNQVISKLTVTYQSLATVAPPSEQQLRDYFEEHRKLYAKPERFDLVHVFAPAGPNAEAEAHEYLAQLQAGASHRGLGPRFPKGRHFRLRTRDNLERIFGARFADAVVGMEKGRWAVAQSDHGWHVVQVGRRHPGGPVDFESLREQLASDYEREQRQSDVRRQVLRLRESYEVLLPDGRVVAASELPDASVGEPVGVGGGGGG